MQTITCQPLPLLTQATSGFGEQREVHEDAKGDGPLHGLAEGVHSNAIKYIMTTRSAEAPSVLCAFQPATGQTGSHKLTQTAACAA